tara:strand:+ start:1243 stop:1518 length:276 start_codon:yes stop_codon:yes gene_type:complete
MFNLENLIASEATREANRSRPNPQRFELCVCCERPVRPENSIQIEAAGGGWDLVDQDDSTAKVDEDAAGYMGVWIVGPICATRIPSRFHIK